MTAAYYGQAQALVSSAIPTGSSETHDDEARAASSQDIHAVERHWPCSHVVSQDSW